MRKTKILLLLSVWVFAFSLQAQSDLPVLMMEVSKGVKYAAPGQTKWAKVITPGVIFTNGRLKLNGKARVKLHCNGASQIVKGKGEHDLSELFREQKQAEKSAFETTFNTFLSAAGNSTKSFGKQWPPDNAPVKAIAPVGGQLATFDLHFYWKTESEADSLQLEILDPDGKAVYRAEVSGGEAVVDPRKTRIFPGRDYSWHIFSGKQPAVASKAKTFTMATLGQKSLVLPSLKEEKSYQDAEPFLKTLMEAAYFEQEEWYYDAYQAYQTLLDKKPANELYQQLYGAFLERCGVE